MPFFDGWLRLSAMYDKITDSIAVIILAAGKGTRMKSDTAKVLHCLAGRPMILYVVDTATRLAGDAVVVVVGTQAERVRSVVSAHARVEFALQERQLGTGHAVLCALPALPENAEHIVILCGDVPLISLETLRGMVRLHVNGEMDITVLGARVENPAGYGRLKKKADGTVERIVEEADATESEKAIKTVNAGTYCVSRKFLETALSQVQTDNAQSEMYLTDIVGIAASAGKKIGLLICPDNTEIYGINSCSDLEKVEALLSSK